MVRRASPQQNVLIMPHLAPPASIYSLHYFVLALTYFTDVLFVGRGVHDRADDCLPCTLGIVVFLRDRPTSTNSNLCWYYCHDCGLK